MSTTNRISRLLPSFSHATPSGSDYQVWRRALEEADTSTGPHWRAEDMQRIYGAMLVLLMPSEGLEETIGQLRQICDHYWRALPSHVRMADTTNAERLHVRLGVPARSAPFGLDLGD